MSKKPDPAASMTLPGRDYYDEGPSIISLVPSWTETLLAAGANIVGRTRYCIHPCGLTSRLEKLGGTKKVDIEKLNAMDARE